MDVVVRQNVKLIQFADREEPWAIPEWQWPFLVDDTARMTHEEWVEKYVNARLYKAFVDQAVPYKRG